MRKSTRLRIAAIGIGFAGLATAAAWASETVSYSYDARGRLIVAAHSGTVNNGVNTSYAYDKAENRANKTTTGAP
jgi:UDP-N-acetyl-D-mannosaminuronate dehydrogenase